MPRLDISSSLLRRRAATGGPLRYLVPDAVAAYITRERLYTAPQPAPSGARLSLEGSA
jgi:nicotinate-nucleotide adenylyltransferase